MVSDGCDLCSAPRALLVAACLIPFFVLCVITLLVALLLTPCLGPCRAVIPPVESSSRASSIRPS